MEQTLCESYDNVLSVVCSIYNNMTNIFLFNSNNNNSNKKCVCEWIRMYDDAHTNTRHIHTRPYKPRHIHPYMHKHTNEYFQIHRSSFIPTFNSKSSRIIFYVLSSVAIAVRIHLPWNKRFKRKPSYIFQHTIKKW